jgi:hypothetical protein
MSLCNSVVEFLHERTVPDRLDLELDNLSVLSVETLVAALTGRSFSITSEDEPLEKLLNVSEESRPLLRWVEMRFLSASGLRHWRRIWVLRRNWPGRITDRLLTGPLPPALVLGSMMIPDLPPIFAQFRGKRFRLIWRGCRHGLDARDFHRRCDIQANTRTMILDTVGNIFGDFTPVEWKWPPSRESTRV